MRHLVSVPLVALSLFCVIQLLALYLWLPHRMFPEVRSERRDVSKVYNDDLPSRFASLIHYGRVEYGVSDTDQMLLLLEALKSTEGSDREFKAHPFREPEVLNQSSQERALKNRTRLNDKDHFIGTASPVDSQIDDYAKVNSFPWSNVTNQVNPHDFRLVINQPEFCLTNRSAQDVFLLVLMVSAPAAFEQRQMQRDSCLSVTDVSGKRIRSIFLLGDSGKSDVTDQVHKEAEQHGDIIMEDFKEDYKNLTLKTMMGFKWASVYCPQATYVLKTDDDVYLSLSNILNLLDRSPRERFVTGYVYTGTKPIRNKRSKWFIEKDSYPREVYPPYCCGIGYILSGELIPKVYTQSLSIPYMFLEDVYVGLCIEKLNVVPKVNVGFFTYRQDYEYCKFKKACAIHIKKVSEIGHYWTNQQTKPKNVSC